MTWYYVVTIAVAILVGATGIITAILKAVWMLASKFNTLELSISSIRTDMGLSISGLRTDIAMNSFKTDATQKDVAILGNKVDTLQTMQNTLQARTIRLEDKVDKLGLGN